MTGWRNATIFCALMIPPIRGIHDCERGWPRVTMTFITGLLIPVGLLAVTFNLLSGDLPDRPHKVLKALGVLCLLVFVVGALASQFAVNALANVRPRH